MMPATPKVPNPQRIALRFLFRVNSAKEGIEIAMPDEHSPCAWCGASRGSHDADFDAEGYMVVTCPA